MVNNGKANSAIGKCYSNTLKDFIHHTTRKLLWWTNVIRLKFSQMPACLMGKLNSHSHMSESFISVSGFGKTKLAKSIFEGFNSIQFYLI